MRVERILIMIMVILSFSCKQRPRYKPSSPINAEIVCVKEGKNTYKLMLVVASQINTPELKLEFVLPEGVKIIEGRPSWRGRVSKFDQRSLTIKCKIPGDRYIEIIGKATAGTFCSVVIQDFNTHLKKAKPRGRAKINARGEKIIEFGGLKK
jgi:hypothetical protein